WVNLPRRRFRPGEPIPFTAGARAENGDVLENAELTATVQLGQDAPREIRLAPEGVDFSGRIDDLAEPGEYSVTVVAKVDGQEIGTAQARFQLAKVDLELADPAANPDALSRLADATSSAGGRNVMPEQLPGLLNDLLRKPPEMETEFESKWRFGDSPLSTWIYFLVFVSTLAIEWFLRKKWGAA
ncbi:MAG: hypothetical protein KDA92_14310, partial [Planctomycetales bacterium]|nr:hypothetical protein [Planctomycetales bacterium]